MSVKGRIRKVSAPTFSQPDGSTRIPKAQGVSLIAERVSRRDETRQASRDKVNKRVATALQNGKLGLKDGELVLAELVTWARQKWPAGDFEGLPRIVSADSSMNIQWGETPPSLNPVIPKTLKTCQSNLKIALSRIHDLELELRQCRKELGEERPLADRQRHRAEKNRQSARKPRK